jgi:precorrin-3B synthase
MSVAEEYGDGRVYLTTRANLQIRGLPSSDGSLPTKVLDAIEVAGLLPSRSHDLVRNVMVSPQTGLAGGRADLRLIGRALEAALLSDPRLRLLPGRFLFALDDGRGDLIDRQCDLGLVSLDESTAQLRIGEEYGPIVPLARVVPEITDAALRFLDARGVGPTAPWHVRELTSPLEVPYASDPRLPAPSGPLSYGEVPGGRHVEVPDGALDRSVVDELAATTDALIVTPWHGILVPSAELT